MQLRIDLEVDNFDRINWTLAPEIKEVIDTNKDIFIKETIEKVESFVKEYLEMENHNQDTQSLEKFKKNFFKSLPIGLWKDSLFVLKAIEACIQTESKTLIPAIAFNSKVFRSQLKNNESFFDGLWDNCLEYFLDDKSFTNYFMIEQEKLYGEDYNREEMKVARLEITRTLESGFKDLDWVLPKLKNNPFIYGYLNRDLKINDNVLAITFSKIGEMSNPRFTYVDSIPYGELAKEPYVLGAFFAFFYQAVPNYKPYFSFALKAIKTETHMQAVLDSIQSEDVLDAIFKHKDFPLVYKQSTNVLMQALNKSKNIYHVLPDYMKASKSVVETMIYKHKAEFLDANAVEYWRSDILAPKLNGPVYEFLINRLQDLSLLKFVHWRRDYDFINSLSENPFEYNVRFSKDDFEKLSGGNLDIAKDLVHKFPNFYEVAPAEIKCNLDCIIVYVLEGLGLFEDRMDFIHPKLFMNDELIFAFIEADIGDVLLKIPEAKWQSKKFMLQYCELLDDLLDKEEQAAFECLYTNMPEFIQHFFENNGVYSNYKRFLFNDQMDKYQFSN